MTEKPLKPPHYVPIVDLMRAVAVIAVVWFHTWQQSWLPPIISLPFDLKLDFSNFVRTGWHGVEIFLFISGFCLMYPLAISYQEHNDENLNIRHYAWRRFIKIVPSYFLATIVMALMLRDTYTDTTKFWTDLWTHLLFIHNFWPETFSSINGAFWSIAIEVQFYLIFPIIAGFFLRRPLTVGIVMTAIAVGFRIGAHKITGHSYYMYYSQLPGMLDLYAGGMWAAIALATFYQWRKEATKFYLNVVAFAAMIVLGLACISYYKVINWMWSHNSDFGYWQTYYRTSLVPILVLFTLSAPMTFDFVNRAIANPAVKFATMISYNLYLWHSFILLYMKDNKFPMPRSENVHADKNWEAEYFFLALAICILVSAAVTFWFELPLLRWGKRSDRLTKKDSTKALVAFARSDLEKTDRAS